ncbi:MAG: hypothetical protein [Olavius algarvensis Delta 4 endosymbiont]|nr:MAG: hypothetical protein [Olavius algarvensis Delta 4 endosymbiont]
MAAFRWLCKNDLDLFSFNYSGHGESGGRFSLASSEQDTRIMLSMAAERAHRAGVPFYGIAACYATIPMLFGTLKSGEPFKKIVFINPLTEFFQGTFLQALYRCCRQGFSLKKPAESLKRSIDSYLELLFPNIARGVTGFGTLNRNRTRVLKVLFEWLSSNVEFDFSLPQTAALCIYSSRDPILDIGGGLLRNASMDCIRRVCSPVTFQAINSDHFLSDPHSLTLTRRAIRAFLLAG